MRYIIRHEAQGTAPCLGDGMACGKDMVWGQNSTFSGDSLSLTSRRIFGNIDSRWIHSLLPAIKSMRAIQIDISGPRYDTCTCAKQKGGAYQHSMIQIFATDVYRSYLGSYLGSVIEEN